MDPEAELMASEQQTGNEWELFKENIRPLKRGRNVQLLNHALRSHSQPALKRSLIHTRRRLIETIDDYKGEDPLQPWLDCIKWVQESFPTGGECSGLLVIYEQCVRTFWHDQRYKGDLRYLKAENCADAEVIYRFLEANEIGQNHSFYYCAYALLMESKNKLKKADEMFNLGIARKAKPVEKLEADYRKFLARSTRKKKNIKDESVEPENHIPIRSFGTVLAAAAARNQTTENSDIARKRVKLQRVDTNRPLSIYSDTNTQGNNNSEVIRNNEKPWHTLATQIDRNKENTSAPSKWISYKVPQKIASRTVVPTPSTCIEVFVDEECAELQPVEGVKVVSSSIMQLRQGNNVDLKKETELLKENPLRNFPPHCLR
ncbi:mitotic spindle checkpoint protein BUBR1 isoform X2 [Dioscorea cayenensis subsp. rotundata]|uniref:Mitotic spindle checkpoint protein BUBR1 isoform X2 n=1 Tax=Dioscorea cayennensis subsp. rotundata TaxID=55577 RepID=A0AB40CQD1_DIOCR|nr:mitotic spindle checkpoint protein BUBR1 isoform X2 [Dioscorea cayenensis subsp. rotundata]